MSKKKIIGVLVGLVLIIVLEASSALALTVQGRLQYFDYGSGRDEPIPWAEIQIWRFWPGPFGIGGVWKHDYTTGTDGDGWFFTQDVFFRNLEWAIRVVAHNSAVSVNDGILGPAFRFWRDPGIKLRPSSDFDVLDFSFTFADVDAARHYNLFNTMRHGYDYANARRGDNDPINPVNVMLDDVLPTFYDPVLVNIHIRSERAFDDIVLIHEYAHFLEHTISGFAWIPSVHDGCRATDAFGSVINDSEHAWMEGFADYFARSVQHFLPAGTLAGAGSPDQWRLESPDCAGAGLPGWVTNDKIEDHVAGILWDLFDAPGDPGTVPEAFDTYSRDKFDISNAIFMIFDNELDWDRLGRLPTIYDFHDAFVNRWPWEHEAFDRLLCGNGIPLGHPCPTTTTTTTTSTTTTRGTKPPPSTILTFPPTTTTTTSTTSTTRTTTTTSTTTTLPPSLSKKICRICPRAFSVRQGRTKCKSFKVWNCGKGTRGTMNWTVTVIDECGWLTITPPTGTSTGEKDTVRACVNTAGLAKGDYQCTISISGDGASNSPQTCVIGLTVR